MKLDEIIRKTGKKEWTVFSHKGRRMGSYSSIEQAEKRLKQIEYFKHLKEEEADVTWDDILKAAKKIHANLKKFDINQIKKGFEDEKEHDEPGPEDVIKGSKESRAETLLKITLAHLKEKPDYYTRLGKAMDEARVKVKLPKKAKLGINKASKKKIAAHHGSNWHRVIKKVSRRIKEDLDVPEILDHPVNHPELHSILTTGYMKVPHGTPHPEPHHEHHDSPQFYVALRRQAVINDSPRFIPGHKIKIDKARDIDHIGVKVHPKTPPAKLHRAKSLLQSLATHHGLNWHVVILNPSRGQRRKGRR